MFEPETFARMDEWNETYQGLWETHIHGSIAGLQLIRSSKKGTQYMLTCSLPDFHESVIIAQLPQRQLEAIPHRINQFRPMPESKKDFKNREVGLSREQIDKVLEVWKQKKSANTLPFIDYVFDNKGRMIVAS
jgi:hypothetical protein